ncbi:MAG: DUF5658 family protein [Planctomycetota bacterium]
MSWSPSGILRSAIAPSPVDQGWYARCSHWIVDARAHRVILLVLGIWLLNAFDLIFTILSHQQGMLDEENPIARWILRLGIPSVVLFKTGLVMIGSYPLLRFRSARVTELGTLVILLAYAMLAVHWSECVELYSVTISHGGHLADIGEALPKAP